MEPDKMMTQDAPVGDEPKVANPQGQPTDEFDPLKPHEEYRGVLAELLATAGC